MTAHQARRYHRINLWDAAFRVTAGMALLAFAYALPHLPVS